MCRLLLGIMLISVGCSKVEPVMSKAGVMTIPRCAKYSEELAVANCEDRGGNLLVLALVLDLVSIEVISQAYLKTGHKI